MRAFALVVSALAALFCAFVAGLALSNGQYGFAALDTVLVIFNLFSFNKTLNA